MTRFISLPILAMVLTIASTVPAQEGCQSGFDVGAPAVVTGSPRELRTTMEATAGECAFSVRLCANLGSPTCALHAIRSFKGRNVSLFEPPPSMDTPASCGEWSMLRLRVWHGRPTRRRFRTTAIEAASGRRRRARLTLLCEPGTIPPPPPPPPPTGCEAGATRPCEGVTGRTIGRQVDFPPSLPIASCTGGDTSSNYLTPTEQLDPNAAAELHVISMYEAKLPGGGQRGFDEHPQGVVDVTVHARPKPVVLYLGSYEPERWDLHLDPDAELAHVYTFGYYEQVVVGAPRGVPITPLGYETGFSCFYGWELSDSEGGCPFTPSIARIRGLTGLVETSFQGCYSGDHFEIPYTADPPRACECTAVTGDETVSPRDVAFPGCEAVTNESQYCLTTAGGTVALLGLDTGSVCTPSAAASLGLYPDSVSLAWRGEAVYACPYGRGLVRASLRDGSLQVAQMPCTAVAVDDAGRLLVSTAPSDPSGSYSPTSLYAFDSWDDALRGEAAAVYPGSGFGSFPERLTVHDGIVYSAWHSTDTIWRRDLVSGTSLADLPLQGYDGWILGLSVTPSGRLVIPGDLWGDTVRLFDATTGEARGKVTPSIPIEGVSCVDR